VAKDAEVHPETNHPPLVVCRRATKLNRSCLKTTMVLSRPKIEQYLDQRHALAQRQASSRWCGWVNRRVGEVLSLGSATLFGGGQRRVCRRRSGPGHLSAGGSSPCSAALWKKNRHTATYMRFVFPIKMARMTTTALLREVNQALFLGEEKQNNTKKTGNRNKNQ